MSVLRGPPCPFLTQAPLSQAEGDQVVPHIRAYRLSGRRWIYNKLELVLRQGGGAGAAAAVAQAAATSVQFAPAHQDSAVAFLLQLDSGAKVQAHVYLCHADAEPRSPGSGTAAASGEDGGSGDEQVAWRLVTRQQCCKGCQGPVLRAIQRFGRVGKRQAAKAAAEGEAEAEGGSAGRKDPRFMYLSLDEACTHVGATAFRLVAAIYNRQGSRLLGTAVSPPIRCLANNDAPTGAAHITMEATLPADWEGWGGAAASKRRSTQPAPRTLKRPSPAEKTPQQPPPGLRTPSTSDKLSLLERPATASRLPALCGTSAQWQLPFPPVPNSAPPRLPVARQLSLPAEPPSPLGLPPSGDSGGQAVSEDCSGLGAVPEDALWATPAAELAAQLAPSLPFYAASQAAAEREAERQLSLLQQLKCSIAAATQPSTSSCGSPLGGRVGGSCSSLPAAPSHSHLHLPALAPAFSMPLPIPSGSSWLSFRSHSLDTSLSAAGAAAYAAAAACAAAEAAAAGSAGGHSGAGCGAEAPAAAACRSPLPPPPEAAPGLGGGGLELGRCCSLDGDLELEAMHSLMSDSQPSGAHVDLAPLLDDVGLTGL